uniref:TFIIIC_sub6 domain-containing protein n=1 Tax=Rhabditophanes sp. KR3021 TaxID=114890 RepID=A0AC35TFR3_9BILA
MKVCEEDKVVAIKPLTILRTIREHKMIMGKKNILNVGNTFDDVNSDWEANINVDVKEAAPLGKAKMNISTFTQMLMMKPKLFNDFLLMYKK